MSGYFLMPPGVGSPPPVDETAPTILSADPSGSYVEGVPIGGTLAADEPVTWSVSGDDAGAVTLDPGTGEWQLEQTDFEAKASYSFTFTATDAADNSTDQVVSITITEGFTALHNQVNARSSGATGWVPPAAVEQYLVAFLVRLDAPTATQDQMFVLSNSDVTNMGLVLRVPANSMTFRLGPSSSAANDLSAGAIESGRWNLIIAQMSLVIAGGRSTVDDRARIWVNGVYAPGSRGWTVNAGAGASRFSNCFLFGSSAATVTNGAFGYAWVWTGGVADLPLIDFDDPLMREKFELTNLDPATGAIDFGGAIGVVTPQIFIHGNAAAANAGTLANRGSAGAFTLAKNTGTYADTDFQDRAVTIGNPAEVTQAAFSENGVTFTFGASVTGGQFELGSWWADHSGQEGVVSISPPSINASRPFTGAGHGSSNPYWYNGAMLDPAAADKLASQFVPSAGGAKQGFDQYPGSGYHVGYHDAYNVDPARTGNPITAKEGTLVKTIATGTLQSSTSGTPESPGSDWGRDATAHMSSLVLLDGKPPTPAPDSYFRPVGSPWLWIKSRDGTGSLLDLDAFPSLSAVPSTPQMFSVYPWINRQHAAFHTNHGVARNIGVVRQSQYYGREYTEMTSKAALLMCLASTSADHKVALANALVQQGMDLAALIEAGGDNAAVSGWGNTSSGRKLALVVAALVTGNARLEDALAQANTMGTVFVEDQQVVEITSEVAAAAGYDPELIGRAEWRGGYNAGPSRGCTPNWLVNYRHSWAAPLTGTYNALKVVPELDALWDNPLFNDYMERYWQTEAGRGFVGNSDGKLSAGNLVFFRTFRQTHGGYFE